MIVNAGSFATHINIIVLLSFVLLLLLLLIVRRPQTYGVNNLFFGETSRTHDVMQLSLFVKHLPSRNRIHFNLNAFVALKCNVKRPSKIYLNLIMSCHRLTLSTFLHVNVHKWAHTCEHIPLTSERWFDGTIIELHVFSVLDLLTSPRSIIGCFWIWSHKYVV